MKKDKGKKNQDYSIYVPLYVKKIKQICLIFHSSLPLTNVSGGKDIWKSKLYQNTITQIPWRVIKDGGYVQI